MILHGLLQRIGYLIIQNLLGEDVNFEDKTISIYDYDSQDEAEFVKKTFESFGWNITNFQEEIDNMQDNQDEMDKNYCISKLKELSVEQLKDICDKL